MLHCAVQFLERNAVYLAAAVMATALNIFSWHLPFFWDTILTSTVSQHLLSHGIGNLILPAELDAGHPPLFYLYEVLWLKVFGASLWVAHLSMLPFVVLGACSFIRLLQLFEFKPKEQWAGLFLFFAIPAVATQYILVSYDAVLLSLFLLSLVLFLENRKWWLAIVLLLMSGITGRGLFAIVSVFFCCHLLHRAEWKSRILPFLPGVLFFAGWYIYHYSQTGYIFSPVNGWSGQRNLADAQQVFKNAISIGRTMFDAGIVVLFLLNVFIFFRIKKLSIHFWMAAVPFLIFSFSFLFLSNPVNHRYYLVVYVLMLLPVLKFTEGKKIVYPLVLAILLFAGNFQVYPGKISNAWDCMLSHLAYQGLRHNFTRFFEKSQVDRSEVGTVFPMNTSLRQTDMKGDTIRMVNANGWDINSFRLVLYTNIGNDFSDEQLGQLKQWLIVKEEKKGMVKMILYQNPQYSL